MSPTAPINPLNALDVSLNAGHDTADRAARTLDVIEGLLTGNERCNPEDGCHPPSILYSADTLAQKLSVIAARLEDIRFRISSPPLAQGNCTPGVYANQAANTAYSTKY